MRDSLAVKAARYRTRIRGMAYAVIERIVALPVDPEVWLTEIPKLFGPSLTRSREERYAVFQEMDERPAGFSGDYFGWHSRLRQVRNHPVHGPELFKEINA